VKNLGPVAHGLRGLTKARQSRGEVATDSAAGTRRQQGAGREYQNRSAAPARPARFRACHFGPGPRI